MSSKDAEVDDLDVTGAAAHVVTDLGGLAARLGMHEFSGLSDDALLSVTQELERASRRVQALLVLAAGAVSDRCLGVPSESLSGRRGCRDGAELLQRVSLLPGSVVRQRVSFADLTRPMPGFSAGEIPPRYPAIAQAFYAGDLPWESALLLTKSLGSVPGWVDPERVAVAERCLVNQAAGYPEGCGLDADGAAVLDPGADNAGDGSDACSPVAGAASVPLDTDTLRQVCAFWCTSLDQDGPEPDDEGQLARRFFRLGRVRNGLVPVRGALLPEVAALLGNLVTGVNSPKTSTNLTGPDADTVEQAGGRAVDESTGGVRLPQVAGEAEAGIGDADTESVIAGGFVDADADGVDADDGFGSAGLTDAALTSASAGAAGAAGAPGVRRSGSGVRFVEGDDPEPVLVPVAGDARSSGQKMHDALMVIAQIAGRAADMPMLGGAPVTVLIQTTQADLAAGLVREVAELGSLAGAEPGACTSTSTDPDAGQAGVAWLHGHDGIPVPVTAATVRHSVCAGATQKVLIDNDGRILGISSPTRIFTPHQRRAIAARDGGCIIPGCTVPATWCEVHHVTPWAEGGPTTTDNGVLLCWWHHRSIEVSGWHVRMVRGKPEVLAPRWVDPELEWRPARPLWGPRWRAPPGNRCRVRQVRQVRRVRRVRRASRASRANQGSPVSQASRVLRCGDQKCLWRGSDSAQNLPGQNSAPGGVLLPYSSARELPTATRVPGVHGACEGLVDYEFSNQAGSECAAQTVTLRGTRNNAQAVRDLSNRVERRPA